MASTDDLVIWARRAFDANPTGAVEQIAVRLADAVGTYAEALWGVRHLVGNPNDYDPDDPDDRRLEQIDDLVRAALGDTDD